MDRSKVQLRELHPHPAREFPADLPTPRSGEDMLREGYAILDRADPRDPYHPERRGIAGPVTNEYPTPDWD